MQFYDSIKPDQFPDTLHVALYFDGDYGAAGRAAGVKFPRDQKRWITIYDDYRSCSIQDFEPGNPCYNDLSMVTTFVAGRHAMDAPARLYSDRSDVARALTVVKPGDVLWWIATLDGKDWTAEELTADLKANFNADIPADRIWANQNVGKKAFDISDLYLEF